MDHDRSLRKLLLGWSLASAMVSLGQCVTTISSFPYTEGFEAAPAWTPGGTNSDWTWGTPAHPTINSAAQGTKAWCVGTLTGSFYSNGQQSWLETPCFDLSLLDHPYLSFSVFWETEPDYDGAGFQYSPNGGITWINVGAVNDNDCLNTNWFNTANITALNLASPRHGWTGTSTTGGCASGGGLGSWVVAAHCLDELPTNAPVKFRFIFGAGTQCNSFDGFAIDEFFIGEAPPDPVNYQFECFGNEIGISNMVNCADAVLWNFGEPSSGADDTSTLAEPSHTYAAPGTYTITVVFSYACRADQITTFPVTILDLQVSGIDPTCTGDPGTATAELVGASGTLTYNWVSLSTGPIPSPADQPTITGLEPGSYYVLANNGGNCPAGATVELNAPQAAPLLDVQVTPISCAGSNDGAATAVVTGGAAPYAITWAPIGTSGASVADLAPGNYVCSVTDVNGCAVVEDVEVTEPAPVLVSTDPVVQICSGASVDLAAFASGGSGGYSFTWLPEGPTVSPTANTTYSVEAMDVNGCTSALAETQVEVGNAVVPSFTWSEESGCAPLCVTFLNTSAVAGTSAWTFGDGAVAGDENAPEHCFTQGGAFIVALTITTADGCVGTYTEQDPVNVFATPDASLAFSPPIALADDPTFRFNDIGTGGSSQLWSFGDPLNSTSTEVSPSFTYPGVDCYTVRLEVVGEAGCSDSAEAEVCVEDAFGLFAPNAFSPNNDGINDGFMVRTTVARPSYFQLEIFDRWGALHYTTNDPYAAWTGDGAPQSVYLWQVRVRDAEDKMQERKGHVVLIR